MKSLRLHVKLISWVYYKRFDAVSSLYDLEMVEFHSVSEILGAIMMLQMIHNEMSGICLHQSLEIGGWDQLFVYNRQVFCADSEASTVGFLNQYSHYSILVKRHGYN